MIDEIRVPFRVFYKSEKQFTRQSDFLCHEDVEIFLLHSGEADTLVEDRVYPLDASSVAIIRPFELHRTQGRKGSSIIRSAVNFKPHFLLDRLGTPEIARLLNRFTQAEGGVPAIVRLQEEKLKELLFQLEKLYTLHSRENAQGPGVFETRACLYICQILFLLEDCLPDDCGDKLREERSSSNKVVGGIIRYIHENLRRDVTMDSISREMNYSKFYLAHVFKEYTGSSIAKYVMARRMSLARRFLAQTEMSVTAIAMELGFTDVSGFVNAFRQYVGISPLKYRKTLRS